MNRKDFFKTAAIAVTGIALGPSLLESCAKSSTNPQGPTVNFTLDLSSPANAILANVGGFLYSNAVIITRVSSDNLGFIALSQACTHQGCTIAYNAGMMAFQCPCHGGTYDANGNVTGGPPPNPLKKYSVTRNSNILTVKG